MKALKRDAPWIAAILAIVVFMVAPLIWAVRVEGKVEVNRVNINHVTDDISEIKTGITAILEKL